MVLAGAPATQRFPFRSARSGALVAAVAAVVGVETAVLHLWLAPSHPAVAWTLTALGLLTLWWIAADFHAMGRQAVVLAPDTLTLEVGRRFALTVPRSAVARAFAPTWRDLPGAEARDFVNATRPADPNVLLVLAAPATARIAGTVPRRVGRIGLHVDDPAALLAALAR